MSKWEDISDILTAKGMKLPVGHVLVFNYEGSPIHLKIRRKAKGKVWAERIRLFSPEEIETIEKENKK